MTLYDDVTYRSFGYVVVQIIIVSYLMRRYVAALCAAQNDSGSAMVGAVIARVKLLDGPCPVRILLAPRHPMRRCNR